jgi:glycosyltransferase involved in cell wall biosynthesis
MKYSINASKESEINPNTEVKLRVSVCITTRNRNAELRLCLTALQNLTIHPNCIIVSDDSTDREVQNQNHLLVQEFSGTTYLKGPVNGVCANRNNALRSALKQGSDFISFIDDDICLDPLFFENTINFYRKLSHKERNMTILTGTSSPMDQDLTEGLKLNFRGYFSRSLVPGVVNIHTAIFPVRLFDKVAWDENIIFGYEDAELCLRAVKNGFKIVCLPSLKSLDIGAGRGTLIDDVGEVKLSMYQVYIESARLYIGIKRYYIIDRSFVRLMLFLIVYIVHMTVYLLKRGELHKLRLIVETANIDRLFRNDVQDIL